MSRSTPRDRARTAGGGGGAARCDISGGWSPGTGSGCNHQSPAEELAEEIDQVTRSFVRPDPACCNTALAGEPAPFPAFHDGLAARSMRGALTAAVKDIGVMGTGGFASFPDHSDKLRHAGALARGSPMRAAVAVPGVAVEAMTTARGGARAQW